MVLVLYLYLALLAGTCTCNKLARVCGVLVLVQVPNTCFLCMVYVRFMHSITNISNTTIKQNDDEDNCDENNDSKTRSTTRNKDNKKNEERQQST